MNSRRRFSFTTISCFIIFTCIHIFHYLISYDMIYLFAFGFLSLPNYYKLQEDSQRVLKVIYKHTALNVCSEIEWFLIIIAIKWIMKIKLQYLLIIEDYSMLWNCHCLGMRRWIIIYFSVICFSLYLSVCMCFLPTENNKILNS